jgi:nucleoside-diphosphate-sugar epimerase
MVSTDLTFNGNLACRELGYRPIYTEKEAIRRTIDYFKKNGPVEI